jgi:subtilisin family serine protease
MRRRSPRVRLATVVLLVAGLVGTAAAAQERPVTKGKAPVRLVVLFDRGTPESVQDQAVEGSGTVLARVPALDARVVEVSGPRTRTIHQELLADDAVRAVEVDAVRSVDAVSLNDPFAPQQPSLDRVDLPEAWEYTTGSSSIVIAVVDTGVDGVGPDLTRSRFVSPINILTGTDHVGDLQGHGTAVASIAAMVGNNGQHGAGGCWSCSIMPVKALSSNGFGLASDVAIGIVWAVDHGADVVNLSLGGAGSGIEKGAIDYAESHGVVVVAAAGNDNSTTPNFPAAHATVLGVAASGSGSDARAPYSNFGSWVKLAAPGTNAALDANGTGMIEVDGTSTAAPVVSGIAGLLLSENPGLTPAQVRSALMSSAADVAYVSSSGGRVDADGALQAIGAGTTSPPGPTTGPAPFLELNPTDVIGGGASSSGVVTQTVSGVKAGGVTFRGVCAWCGGLTLEVLNNGGGIIATQAGGRNVTLTTNVGDGVYRFRLRGLRGGLVRYLISYSQ